ncbi:MAG: VirB3 family type IV secretion system protein [Burkholderiales bacterium]|nr:VirB3 family type IV secretion system protein [Burkholderiales bacterium]
MSDEIGLRSDTLFGGLTRPATFFGLPVEALVVIVGGAVGAFLIASLVDAPVVWKVGCLGIGVVMYGIARLICTRDPRAFRYLFLMLDTKGRHRTRSFWHSGSYSPVRNFKRTHTVFPMKEALINNARTLSDFVPYSTHVDPYNLRTKNGDTLTVIAIEGVAHEAADDADIQSWHDALVGLLRNFAGDDVALWTHTIRQKRSEYPSGEFEAGSFAGELDAKYRASLSGLNLMENRHYLTVVLRGKSRMGRFFSFGAKRTRESVRESINDARERMNEIADMIMAGLGRYGARRLSAYEHNGVVFSEPLELFAQLINGEAQPIAVPRGNAAYSLVSSRISFGVEQFEVRTPTSRQVGAMLAVNEYQTERTEPGHLNLLLTLPFPFILTQSFCMYGRTKALELLKRQQSKLVNAEDASESQVQAIDAAKDDAAANRVVFGEHHLSMSILAKDARELADRLSTAKAALSESGFTVVREDECIEAAFFAQLPANFRMRPRPSTISSSNLIGFTGFHNYPTGLYDGNQWGPAVTLLKTTSGTPFYFNFHVPPSARKQREAREGSSTDES